MQRPAIAAVALVGLLALALALTAVPAAAHGNHASADSQVSANGTVVVETAYVSADGWVVLHRDDGGSPGEPIGHARISAGELKTDVAVAVDDDAWAGWSNGTVWATLHRDAGDDSFDPEEDNRLRSFGRPSGETFTLARGDAAAVTAAEFAPQRANGTVTVRRVTLPEEGHVVLHNRSLEGEAVGHASLSAGTHRNVSVELSDSYFQNRQRGTVVAALYADDGDGSFDESDGLVRAGGAPVTTEFGVTSADAATDALVTTATPGGGGEGANSDTPTDGGGPGFGVPAALVALVLTLLVGVGRP